jgi:16S rRNA (guanine(966)-N(2))-methyltransferase RsmD
MRERTFAVLADRVHDSRFLDLFAGTGAVGLEALSRGARSVVFVEKHRGAATLIEKNSASFDLTTDRAELMVRIAATAIDQLARRGGNFDIAWADPPFECWREGLDVVLRRPAVSPVSSARRKPMSPARSRPAYRSPATSPAAHRGS